MWKNAVVWTLVVVCGVVEISAQRGGGGRGAGGNEIPSERAFQASADAQRHVAAAMTLARNDLVDTARVFCTPAGPPRLAAERQAAGLPAVPNSPVEPIRLFENVYYVGLMDTGSFVITTSAGIIVFDALNNEAEARDVLVGGMKTLGLDPSQIRYLVIGHSHNDHTGGAAYIQNTYKPRVIMAPAEWDAVAAGARPGAPMPARDMDMTEGQRITLGDTTVTLVMPSGHTPETVGMLVPVRHLGRTHTAFILSAAQMPNRRSVAAWERVFGTYGKAMNAETAISTHPNLAINKMAAMQAIGRQYPQGPHPLLYGPERFGRYMDIALECGRARAAALESER